MNRTAWTILAVVAAAAVAVVVVRRSTAAKASRGPVQDAIQRARADFLADVWSAR